MSAKLTIYKYRVRKYAARSGSFDERVRIAKEIMMDARPLAPVLTGAYRGGIDIKVDGLDVSVVDSDEDAIYKEYGTSDTPAHAALTTAAMKHGRYRGMRPRRSRMK
ncbi:HK97 gp10 family phage protein [Corynebacterium coyleae]|uniref:HK97 gp10 family phage protein n=2 Tax=Corynebacterium coyleae TaxID=53374 RepID=A0ABX8KVK5_9CORY|nr:HK97 gp10 family phage protein [Corynebacterium coyleae]